jgi:hypothetical protein
MGRLKHEYKWRICIRESRAFIWKDGQGWDLGIPNTTR